MILFEEKRKQKQKCNKIYKNVTFFSEIRIKEISPLIEIAPDYSLPRIKNRLDAPNLAIYLNYN